MMQLVLRGAREGVWDVYDNNFNTWAIEIDLNCNNKEILMKKTFILQIVGYEVLVIKNMSHYYSEGEALCMGRLFLRGQF